MSLTQATQARERRIPEKKTKVWYSMFIRYDEKTIVAFVPEWNQDQFTRYLLFSDKIACADESLESKFLAA